MEHTPGPWTIQTIEPDWDKSGDIEARILAPLKVDGFGFPGKSYNVAILKFVSMKRSQNNILRDEGEANARLIAAAPDLFSALIGLVHDHVRLVNSGDCGSGNWDAEKDAVIIAARAAIARATDA